MYGWKRWSNGCIGVLGDIVKWVLTLRWYMIKSIRIVNTNFCLTKLKKVHGHTTFWKKRMSRIYQLRFSACSRVMMGKPLWRILYAASVAISIWPLWQTLLNLYDDLCIEIVVSYGCALGFFNRKFYDKVWYVWTYFGMISFVIYWRNLKRKYSEKKYESIGAYRVFAMVICQFQLREYL